MGVHVGDIQSCVDFFIFWDSRDCYIQNHDPEINPPIPPLDEKWEAQKQQVQVPVVETVPEDPNTQPGYFEVELAPPQQMEEASDASSSDKESKPEDNAAVFAASGRVRRIDSNVYLGINTVSDPQNLVYTTLDWENMNNDPMYKQHHDMFTRFVNSETCELLDPDGLHPFYLPSKLNTDDYPTFNEVLQTDKETCNEWFDAMDKELQDLFK